MSSFGNAALTGLAWGAMDLSNIVFGGLTSYGMYRTGIDPFQTLYLNLDSPSGLSSWAHPSYASRVNVELNAAGVDTTFAPLTSSLGGTIWGGGFLGSGLFSGGGIFGFGFPTSTYISSNTFTHLGMKPGFRGYI